MTTQHATTIIHTEVRCTRDINQVELILEEMLQLQKEHGVQFWRLCKGIDHITPCNYDRDFFYFEGITNKPAAHEQ